MPDDPITARVSQILNTSNHFDLAEHRMKRRVRIKSFGHREDIERGVLIVAPHSVDYLITHTHTHTHTHIYIYIYTYTRGKVIK